jgi:hypothetical protein
MSTRVSRYEELVQFLADSNVPRRENHAELSVEIPVMLPPLTGSVYLRWERKMPYLQVIHPFLLDVPPARIPDIESAITRINATLTAPGLGFHHDKRFVYMRRTVPAYADGISTSALQQQISDVLAVAKEFVGPLTKIVGGAAGEQILN